ITDQQTGCPTKAINLAKFILEELILENADFGLHHFTDGVAMTWYSFAKKILEDNKMNKGIKLEKAKDFSTFAKRPIYSVLE
ncbi:MAG: sugar nucleotide-binding protein, partial [Maribacter sp.]